MLAAVLKDFNRLELEELPVPAPGPGEALVRIRACGFCATDFKAIRLMERFLVDPEQVITHCFPLTEIDRAVAAMASGQKNKVIVQPQARLL